MRHIEEDIHEWRSRMNKRHRVSAPTPKRRVPRRLFRHRWFCWLRLHWLVDPGVYEEDGDWRCKSCGAVIDRAVAQRPARSMRNREHDIQNVHSEKGST